MEEIGREMVVDNFYIGIHCMKITFSPPKAPPPYNHTVDLTLSSVSQVENWG